MRKAIKQENSLSQLLFILIMDRIIKQIKKNSSLYAEYVVLIANIRNKMQKTAMKIKLSGQGHRKYENGTKHE